jgi:hypothetical protein
MVAPLHCCNLTTPFDMGSRAFNINVALNPRIVFDVGKCKMKLSEALKFGNGIQNQMSTCIILQCSSLVSWTKLMTFINIDLIPFNMCYLNHSYDILGARMLWKPKEARILKNFIEF